MSETKRESNPIELEREIKKEVEFPEFMNYDLVEKWGDGISLSDRKDFTEWRPTPVIPVDLSKDGYGKVLIKNEADERSNPTGTIKDRAAWELATLYRDYARALYLKIRIGTLSKQELEQLTIPRLSLITSGNEGRAVAECFKKNQLPPPKIIVGQDINEKILKEILKLRADVYTTDLSLQLTPEDIYAISNNPNGVDITSIRSIEPSSLFYDQHVHESFNENPNEIYVPYGSGRVMENYLTWQVRSMRNDSEGRKDPRLKIPTSKVISMNIFGAEPKNSDSIADKLSAPFKPFLLFKDQDVKAIVNFSFTGRETAKETVAEEQILKAHKILTDQGIKSEPSGSAGLALYIDRYEKGLIQDDKKILVVNTGKGLTQN
ncbi:MAG: hypothetical protein A2312_02635 [Candidatus Staskawiczbacteria bacterium RIFOXYB2_FULL_32_9]|uniref:Tryptophan synthase beta chain-like PALP domain-containing protein n=1 Tax=Candidatus Staskawiczbacteria bacterium RIFOXYD1_FULL_32_13 TaxID=1802234 RepID=A0A1G2JMX6_9BACT|nr:MAG: hypothetical protein UR22_C0006G0003 [Parcubacteria group bacterium GW2011_GWC2_32_10]OGZ80410.1 MAG: hypothetical protein A2256_02900 [Candidatus Staskawiczbacteria bacterium RIFOXYA2_FULL_32_7]OGZ80874.1 MAG: hypothetical protein A2360_04255 [Candidatus Staskawiczbacteria bacterium RIFOXYB1_FULL_32_11]OGZ84264.1 MAG: hypothetical protein A2312_02635 [Candidatus Staskawiczbacteria bacterium RIFOXYB2_FULL_32_9]OGZ85873.1 MAG: hypothetical protein A2463_03270 [Candidatus Staskawiczbacter